MSQPSQTSTLYQSTDPRWRDLYRLGAIASILIAVSVAFAIAAFFIWPYKDGFTSMETIFAALQTDRVGGLLSLDLSMLLIAPINILMFLAIYAAIRRVNDSYALVALVLALMAVILVIQVRPLVELALLSDKYAAATDPAEKAQYLSAGITLHAYFSGTSWAIQTIFFLIAGFINSWLMLRTHFFGKATAWLGIINSVVGLGFFLPVIGPLFLLLNTIGTVPWCFLLARDFLHLVKGTR